jgi:hypothetical protein
LQFLYKKKIIFSDAFFSIFGHQSNPDPDSLEMLDLVSNIRYWTNGSLVTTTAIPRYDIPKGMIPPPGFPLLTEPRLGYAGHSQNQISV